MGRIDRTLFMLEWLHSPERRRRVTIGLNKGEAKNALTEKHGLVANTQHGWSGVQDDHAVAGCAI